MKFVSKISMVALILMGLAVSFVGCQKEEDLKTSASNNQIQGLKYTSYSKLKIPANYLKSTSITYGSISKVGKVAYVNNGTSVTTWNLPCKIV